MINIIYSVTKYNKKVIHICKTSIIYIKISYLYLHILKLIRENIATLLFVFRRLLIQTLLHSHLFYTVALFVENISV